MFTLNSTMHTEDAKNTFYDAVAYLTSQFPMLNDKSVQGYTYLLPYDFTDNSDPPLYVFFAAFVLLGSTKGTPRFLSNLQPY